MTSVNYINCEYLFKKVILMLTSDLDGQEERDRTCFANLLNLFVKELDMEKPDVTDLCTRSNKREVHLVIMRLLSNYTFNIKSICLH